MHEYISEEYLKYWLRMNQTELWVNVQFKLD